MSFRRAMLVALLAGMLALLITSCTTSAPPAAPTQEVPEKKYKVGLLVFKLGDRSYWDSAARGIQWANEQLPNVEGKVFEHNDESEMELTSRALADQGYDLVICMGWDAAAWTAPIAEQYPNTHFFVPGGGPEEMANTSGGDFKEHEGCFTVGMIAALMTKTGKIGFVGGWDDPLLWRFLVGYEEGIKYVNPDIQVVVAWANDFQNPSKGKELALAQYADGCDIVFAAAGKTGMGVLAAAKEQNKLAIGVDSDQCWIEPGYVMTSMLKRVDMVVLNKCKELSEGKLQTGNVHYGLAEGLVGACWLYDFDEDFSKNGAADLVAKMPEVVAKVQAAVSKIQKGEMCVTDYMEVFPCDKPPPEGGMGQ